MSNMMIEGCEFEEVEEDGKVVYNSLGKLNGYDIKIVCLNEPNGNERALKAIKKFFEKEIF